MGLHENGKGTSTFQNIGGKGPKGSKKDGNPRRPKDRPGKEHRRSGNSFLKGKTDEKKAAVKTQKEKRRAGNLWPDRGRTGVGIWRRRKVSHPMPVTWRGTKKKKKL